MTLDSVIEKPTSFAFVLVEDTKGAFYKFFSFFWLNKKVKDTVSD